MDLELKKIQRNIEDIRHCEMGLESNEDNGWFVEFYHEGHVFMKECEVMLEDCIVQNVEEERSNVL